jgi:hypothetical protein
LRGISRLGRPLVIAALLVALRGLLRKIIDISSLFSMSNAEHLPEGNNLLVLEEDL